MSRLQELLNLGLVEIDFDDSRFDKMQSAAVALMRCFEEEPGLLIPSTLIALDEDVDANDGLFELVEGLVLAEWKTLRNRHVDRPRQLLRSIVIDALASAADTRVEVSAVLWNIAASRMRHGQSRLGKARPVIEPILHQARDAAEEEAVRRAGMVEPPSRGPTQGAEAITALTVAATIETEDVIGDVARAAGPSFAGATLVDANPHWSNAAPWSAEFTPRMAAALVKVVNLGGERLSESIGEALANELEALEERLRDELIVRHQTSTAQANRMRLDVLWWSESLYSPSLQCGYRELPISVAAVTAAADLASITPALAPASVDYLLGETVFRLGQLLEADQKRPVQGYLYEIAQAKPQLRNGFRWSMVTGGRAPLAYLVAEAITGAAASADVIRARSGIEGSLELSPADFSMWVFREIQAGRLVEGLR